MRILFNLILSFLSMDVPLTTEKIKIDGVFDEGAWKSALVLNDFKVFEPEYLGNPAHYTEVLILQDESAIFVGIRGTSFKVKRPITHRDDQEGDFVGIYFDTFDNGRTAYYFGVNFAGVQVDKIVTAGGMDESESWDGVWYSATKVSDSSFSVELKIPFKTLHYRKDNPVFGFEATRYISEYNQRVFLGIYPRERGLDIAKFPVKLRFKLKGEPSNLELLPVFLIENNDGVIKLRPGLDSRFALKENFAVNATFNPDFAQIEADPFRVNTGKYENFLDERRPFFTDANEVFSFETNPYGLQNINLPIIPFYTRRIGKGLLGLECVPILFGIKSSYKSKEFETGVLTALTGDKTIVYEGDTLNEPMSLFNAFSFRRQFFSASSVNFLYAGKMEKDKLSKNHAFGFDLHLVEGSTEFAGGYVKSFYEEINGDAFALGVVRNTRKYGIVISYVDIDEDFDVSEIGFTPWTGVKKLVIGAGPHLYLSSHGLNNASFTFGYSNTKEFYDYGNSEYEFWGRAGIRFSKGGGVEARFSKGKAYEGFYYPRTEVTISGWLPGRLPVRGYFALAYLHDYNYSRGYVGNIFSHSLGMGTNTNSRLSFRVRYGGWLEMAPDNNIEDYTVSISPRVSYPLSKDLVLNFSSQVVYSTQDREVLFGAYSFVLSYNFRPKSWFYFVLSRAYDSKSSTTNSYGVLKIRYLIMI
ncbi:MAG: DUF5916 domain-containing protein [Candidatus Hydrothermia bacterium]